MKELPKGLRLDHNYVQIRIMHKGSVYCRNFGLDSPFARELAIIHLAEKRKEILMGRFGIETPIPSKKFKEAVKLWFGYWQKETRPDGNPKHGEKSISEVARVLDRTLLPAFGAKDTEAIKPRMVQDWRAGLVTKGLGGTSANRYQAVLSSFFNGVKQLIDLERIEPFKLPMNENGIYENPCDNVEKAPNNKRKRVLSVMELKALKAACLEVKDDDLWEICEMALKSLLRKKDLFKLEAGIDIDTIQAKTQRSIQLPVSVLRPLKYENFRKRWEAVRKAARLVDVQFRDLRKTGATLLKMKQHSNKLISEFLGHASTRTTEIYMVEDAAHLKPLADDLNSIIKGL